MSVRTASAPATEPQINFIRTLLEQRVVPADAADRLQDKIDNPETFFKGQASDAIGWLKAQGYKPREVTATAPVEPVEVGVYEKDGQVFQVKMNRAKSHAYALVLVDGDYVYSPGTMKFLTAADRISVERAVELSALRGSCIRCGRVLKVEKSVRDGIGPVCVKYFAV